MTINKKTDLSKNSLDLIYDKENKCYNLSEADLKAVEKELFYRLREDAIDCDRFLRSRDNASLIYTTSEFYQLMLRSLGFENTKKMLGFLNEDEISLLKVDFNRDEITDKTKEISDEEINSPETPIVFICKLNLTDSKFEYPMYLKFKINNEEGEKEKISVLSLHWYDPNKIQNKFPSLIYNLQTDQMMDYTFAIKELRNVHELPYVEKFDNVLNLTRFTSQRIQLKQGMIDMGGIYRDILNNLNKSFWYAPNHHEISDRADELVSIAKDYINQLINENGIYVNKACIAGAPYLVEILEDKLFEEGITPVYSFTSRIKHVEYINQGLEHQRVTLVNRHEGFIEARKPTDESDFIYPEDSPVEERKEIINISSNNVNSDLKGLNVIDGNIHDEISNLMELKEKPSYEELRERAVKIADLVYNAGYKKAYFAGAAYLNSFLRPELEARHIDVFYHFTERRDPRPIVKKQSATSEVSAFVKMISLIESWFNGDVDKRLIRSM